MEIDKKVDLLLSRDKKLVLKRTKRLTNRLLLVGCVALLIVGCTAGALWIVSRNVDISVTTGSMDWEYTDIAVVEEYDPQCICTISFEVVDSDIALTITGAYPGYSGELYFTLYNSGDIKIQFSALTVPSEFADWIVIGLDTENTVLNPGETSSDIFFLTIVIPDTVEMGQLFTFTIGLSAVQLNEQPPPG